VVENQEKVVENQEKPGNKNYIICKLYI
jgi:hypothetical protein